MTTRGPGRLDEEVDEPVDGGRDGLAPADLEVRPQGASGRTSIPATPRQLSTPRMTAARSRPRPRPPAAPPCARSAGPARRRPAPDGSSGRQDGSREVQPRSGVGETPLLATARKYRSWRNSTGRWCRANGGPRGFLPLASGLLRGVPGSLPGVSRGSVLR